VKERKNAFWILGGISLLLIVVCALLLTEVIQLPARGPAPESTPGLGEIVDEIFDDEDLAQLVDEAYARPRGWEEQVDNFFTGLKTGNAELLFALYHPSYWEAGGLTLPAALEMMRENVSELTIPEGLTWTVVAQEPPTEDVRLVITETYADYGLTVPIADIVALDVETNPSLRQGGAPSEIYRLTFLQIGGSWFLFEDISQMFY